jgi:hypothetical protein
MFNREIFFDSVRDLLFSGALTQQNVDGQNVILGLWEHGDTGSPMDDVRWLAYSLATVFHETAQTMWPIEEYGHGSGQPYGVPDENGNRFYGRGFVQLTWKDNYQTASAALGLIGTRDLTMHPDLALDSLIAARVMFRGMAEGWFTGAKLGMFFNEEDDNPLDARTIINGHDCDEQIAGYHEAFLGALKASSQPGYDPEEPPEVVIDITATDGVKTTVLVNGDPR